MAEMLVSGFVIVLGRCLWQSEIDYEVNYLCDALKSDASLPTGKANKNPFFLLSFSEYPIASSVFP